MGKKILDSKILYAFLAVVITVVLWFYVMSIDGNVQANTIYNIPVTFTGTETLEAKGLMVVDDEQTANLTVRATPRVLVQLTDKTVQLVVDVSGYDSATTYTNVAYDVVLPSGVSRDEVEIVSGSNGNTVSFEIAVYREREVEIRGRFTGSVAEGYLPGGEDDFVFSPEALTISGQESLVNQVAYVLVTVDGENLTQTVSDDRTYQLIWARGDVLPDLDVTCETETIHTTFPILATAELPLEVEFTTGGGVDAADVRYELSVDSITVAGSQEAVDAIVAQGSITVATIDLAEVADGDVLTFPIALTEELTNITGTAEVTVTIDLPNGLTTKTVETTNIRYLNAPDGWQATLVTQSVTVELRGPANALEPITGDDVRVVADLSGITEPSAGQYSISNNNLYIYVDVVGNDVGAIGTDYRVVVSLTPDQ